MNHTRLAALVALLASSSLLLGQTSSSSLAYVDTAAAGEPAAGRSAVNPPAEPAGIWPRPPFSRIAFGTAISPLGFQVSLTTNLHAHLNLRTTGNIFGYSTTYTSNGIPADGHLNLKSAGAAVDIYPFRNGFRVSPGLLFYNDNGLSAKASIPAGTSFTLNDQTYYSAVANPATAANPVTGSGSMNLHTTNPAFTITAGWGNTLPRHGHWSFPFELGVALTGAPRVQATLNGWACTDQAQILCTDVNSPTDPIALEIQKDLQSEVEQWASDVEWLKTYPIASFGVAYSFSLRNK